MEVETKIEFTKSALVNADSLVRWAVVLNGAAAAGLLTFLGGAIDKQDKFYCWDSFGTSLLLFSLGIGCALVCSFTKLMALNYMSQEKTPSENSTKEEIEIYLLVGDRAIKFALASFVALFLGFILFSVGIYIGKIAIFG